MVLLGVPPVGCIVTLVLVLHVGLQPCACL